MNEQNVAALIAAIIILLVGFPIHEFSHAWTANRLGDSTARFMGRISLDPRRHFDPTGGILLLVSAAVAAIPLGWAKPTPVNPSNLQGGHRGEAVVAAAGPVSNLVMATAGAFVLRAIGFSGDFQAAILSSQALGMGYDVLIAFVWINVLLFCFNLIPISPLDGWAVLKGFLSPMQTYRYRFQLAQIERYGPMLLIGLIAIGFIVPGGGPISLVLGRVANGIFLLLTGFST
ncbi:MAG TPA: site-2 protease family protein [Candidatus Limnocylindrales bacterium]